MTFSGVGDVARAYDEGRTHTQRFYKGSGPGVQNLWTFWGQGAGQPAADFLVGTALVFSPRTQTNQVGGIWPGVTTPAGYTKHIIYATAAMDTGSASNQWEDLLFFDLLGYYPFIDGTDPDPQEFDNTLTLPRYTSGVGVQAFIMGHVSSTTANSTGTMTYVDDTDTEKTVSLRTTSQTNLGVQTGTSTSATNEGGIWIPLASGSKGVKRIVSVAFSTSQPGGYLCIGLAVPLFRMTCGGPQPAAVSGTRLAATEKCFTCRNGSLYPRVYDGAAINVFHRHSGGSNSASFFGDLTFAWGNT